MGAQFDNQRNPSNHAATSSEPLRIRFAERRQAVALSRELADFGNVEVHNGRDTWEVCLHGSKADGVVVKALDAVRDILAGDRAASADIFLDGRRYRMTGE